MKNLIDFLYYEIKVIQCKALIWVILTIQLEKLSCLVLANKSEREVYTCSNPLIHIMVCLLELYIEKNLITMVVAANKT